MMATGMEEYEAAVAPVKNELFDTVWVGDTKPRNILEIGIGTGPNLKYIQARSVMPVHQTGIGAFQFQHLLH